MAERRECVRPPATPRPPRRWADLGRRQAGVRHPLAAPPIGPAPGRRLVPAAIVALHAAMVADLATVLNTEAGLHAILQAGRGDRETGGWPA